MKNYLWKNPDKKHTKLCGPPTPNRHSSMPVCCPATLCLGFSTMCGSEVGIESILPIPIEPKNQVWREEEGILSRIRSNGMLTKATTFKLALSSMAIIPTSVPQHDTGMRRMNNFPSENTRCHTQGAMCQKRTGHQHKY